MSWEVAKTELKNKGIFYDELHKPNDDDSEIMCHHFLKIKKSCRYTTNLHKLNSISDGIYTVYNVDPTFHHLQYTYITTITPKISVKEEFKNTIKIKLPHRYGINCINKAIIKDQKITYQTLDNVFLDFHLQFFQNNGTGKRDLDLKYLGDLPELTTFSTYLPPRKINYEIPWFYSQHISLAFPIFYKGSSLNLEHRIVYKKYITDMLIMVKKESDGSWEYITKDKHEYIDVDSNLLPTPEMYGKYSLNHKNQIESIKNTHSGADRIRDFYIYDVKCCDNPKDFKFGESCEDIIKCKTPCTFAFWAAQNKTAYNICNYSNYTTNPYDIETGHDPIKLNSLYYSTEILFENMTSDHFNVAISRHHCNSAPFEEGYHAYNFSDSLKFTPFSKATQDLSSLNTRFKFYIEDGVLWDENTGCSIKDIQNQSSFEKLLINRIFFNIKIRLLCLKRFRIRYDKDNNPVFSITK